MVLTAGRGERLRPLTDHTPKPLLEVRGAPLLEHQLNWLAQAGVSRVVMNLHHLGEQIEAFCGNGERWGMEIVFSREPELLETGGGIVKALPLLGGEPFLLLNGDIFTTFPLAALLDPPRWADAHLLLTPTPSFREAGDFEFAHGRITGRGTRFVYCGIAVIRPRLLEGRGPGAFSLRETYFEAAADGRLSAQVWDGYWTDIGTREQLAAANSAEI